MRFAIAKVLLLVSATTLAAQAPAAVPPGAFAGYLKSTLDGIPIRTGDVRLYFIDSTKEVSAARGAKTVDIFIDTARSRVAASDSTGYFAIWRLAAGRYLLNIRRIGFTPMEAIVNVDSETVFREFRMDPIAAILNKVEIREVSTAMLSKRLDREGFMDRKKFNASHADFINRGDIDKVKAQTLRDILSRYGIFNNNADFQVDRMALEYYDIQDYPAVLVAGIEIYRRTRPTEFNRTRAGPGAMDPGANLLPRPLVVIWTYVP